MTLGFTNSNVTGLWSVIAFCITILSMSIFRSRLYHCFSLFILILLINITYYTMCRNAIVSLFACVLFCAIYKIKKEVFTSNLFAATISLFPILFFLIYYFYINRVEISFLTSEGKGADSRIYMWRFATSHFLENIITGDYYGISEGTGHSQMHNTHVDVLASYGTVVYLMWVAYVYILISKIGKQLSTNVQYISFICFLNCYLLGVFEAAMVSGAVGIQNYMLFFLLYAQYNGKDSVIRDTIKRKINMDQKGKNTGSYLLASTKDFNQKCNSTVSTN